MGMSLELCTRHMGSGVVWHGSSSVPVRSPETPQL